MSERNTTLAERLREARTASALSLREIARRSGTDAGYLSKLEKGSSENPGADVAEALSRTLDVSRDWLLLGSGPMRLEKPLKESEADTGRLYCLRRTTRPEYLCVFVGTVKRNSFNGPDDIRADIGIAWNVVDPSGRQASRFLKSVAVAVKAAYIALTGDSDIEVYPCLNKGGAQ